ncbi:MAG: glycogen/starch synthase [Weeksellaceae bacterium]
MKVYHLSAECYPVAKVGGLADVVGALPKYQNRLGIEAAVIMPWYNRSFTLEHAFKKVFEGVVALRNLHFKFQIMKEKDRSLGFDLYLIRIEGLLDRSNVYGYDDDALQFIGFQSVALYWMRETNNIPDILHCHDHHTGLVPFLIQYSAQFEKLKNVKTVGTIHNGQYQGWMGWEMSNYMPEFDRKHSGILEWNNVINPMAALVKCAYAFTTVSEGYLNELMHTKGAGLESLYQQEQQKAFGIVNGIDTEIWNPRKDPFLSENFGVTNFVSKKEAIKKSIYKQYGMNENLPLVSFIGRFALEKGADLLPGIIQSVIRERSGDVNFFVLGSGNSDVENRLKDVQYRNSGNFALELGYNEPLSHQIYGGSDYILMPSRVEPCGLNQMYAMAYGTIPIVCKTGGLNDTVPDVSTPDGRGFQFNDPDENGAVWAVHRALDFESNTKESRKLRRKIMKIDFSWEQSAKKYISLYEDLNSEK